jgi:hypothetical protein
MSRFADAYKTMRQKQCESFAGCNFAELNMRPLCALNFWTTICFEKVGTNDPSLPRRFRESIKLVLESRHEVASDETLHHSILEEDFPEAVWQRFDAMTASIKAEKKRGAVYGLLSALRTARQANLFAWIGSMSVADAWKKFCENNCLTALD